MTSADLPGGETRPPSTTPPPSSRDPAGASTRAAASGSESARPNLWRGLLYGLGMSALFVLGWVVLAAILELRVGLVVLAAVAGWLVGTAVALGAEPGTLRRQRSTVALAVAVCLGLWLVGTFAAYLVSLAILPDSTVDLVTRMANAPFVEGVAAAFLPGGLLELLALAGFGWLGAR